ncbi:MAG: hypothetical protein K6U74_07020 [Firmicutes bacterium]|nr:hypothetical protein [Bacillota bacterium]
MNDSSIRAVLPKVPHTLCARGDAAMPKRKDKFKRDGNVVFTTRIGNTTIRICDDFCARTSEEIERVLDDMHAAGWAIVESAHQVNGDDEGMAPDRGVVNGQSDESGDLVQGSRCPEGQ